MNKKIVLLTAMFILISISSTAFYSGKTIDLHNFTCYGKYNIKARAVPNISSIDYKFVDCKKTKSDEVYDWWSCNCNNDKSETILKLHTDRGTKTTFDIIAEYYIKPKVSETTSYGQEENLNNKRTRHINNVKIERNKLIDKTPFSLNINLNVAIYIVVAVIAIGIIVILSIKKILNYVKDADVSNKDISEDEFNEELDSLLNGGFEDGNI